MQQLHLSLALPPSEADEHSVALALLPSNNSQSEFVEDGRALAQKRGDQPQIRQRWRQRQHEQGGAPRLGVAVSAAAGVAVTVDGSNSSLSRLTSVHGSESSEVLERASLESWAAAFRGYLAHHEPHGQAATRDHVRQQASAAPPLSEPGVLLLGVALVLAALAALAALGTRWHRRRQQQQQQALQQHGKVRPPPPPADAACGHGADGGADAGAPPPVDAGAPPTPELAATQGSSLGANGRQPWGRTAGAICLLMGVAASKTVATKLLFEQVAVPVAFSSLSCVTTLLLTHTLTHTRTLTRTLTRTPTPTRTRALTLTQVRDHPASAAAGLRREAAPLPAGAAAHAPTLTLSPNP